MGVEVFLGCYFRAMEKPSKSQPYWNVLMGSTPPLHSNNNSNNNTNNRSNQPKRNNRNRTHNINKSEITPNKFRADIVIAADGCHSRVCQEFGFQQKTRGKKKLIGITCNFENRKTLEERRLKEFSLISFLNRRRFRELKEEVGIELENLVFLRDETLYFVYTPKISSLVERGVLRSGEGKPSDLLRRDNVNQTELEKVGKEIAAFCGVPLTSEYLRIGGRKDIQLFDFSERTVCNRQMMVVTPASYYGEGEKGEEEEKDEQLDHELFVGVVGDALLTPFWPLGTGANRAFLSGMDVSFLAGRFCQGERKDELLARRMMSRLMESSEETMRKDWVKYTIDPKTRYIC
uniref:[F-actin]-monooxygenase MICAL1-3-like Rossman domain-containing protein n=1 Tax=Paramoeba aestuarina TaxID=180227 RepID=A0A7S4PFV0_9EUKA